MRLFSLSFIAITPLLASGGGVGVLEVLKLFDVLLRPRLALNSWPAEGLVGRDEALLGVALEELV